MRRRRLVALAVLALLIAGAAIGLSAAGGDDDGSHAPSGGASRHGAPTASSDAHHAGAPARVAGGTSAAAPLGRRVPRARGSAAGSPASVTVDASHPGPAVPRDFLGLSFEAKDLPEVASYARRGDLASLLRMLGPGVMRFGGTSVDQHVVHISPADLQGLAVLARETGWRVLLTVGLGHYDPQAAAQEVRAARAALGASLAGVAVGNEPDAYVHKGFRSPSWSFAAYRRQADAYRTAIKSVAPQVPLVGPDASSGIPPLSWVRAEAASEHPPLLTDHYYPSSRCGYTPVLSDLLSPATQAQETAMLGHLARISRTSHTPLRLDETNNISCDGQPGVSNTFASALWALDYISRAISAGVVGLNFHDLIGQPLAYSPLAASGREALATGALHAKPEFYALLASSQLLGDRPLSARVAPAGAGLTAGALAGRDGRWRIVLVDGDPPGSRPLAVHLDVPRRLAGGSILRLTAPSLATTRGVRLGGAAITTAGTWKPRHLSGLYGGPGSLSLTMPPSSAALVTLYP